MRGVLSEFAKDSFDRAIFDFAQKVRLLTRLGLDREPDPQASCGAPGRIIIQVNLLQPVGCFQRTALPAGDRIFEIVEADRDSEGQRCGNGGDIAGGQ